MRLSFFVQAFLSAAWAALLLPWPAGAGQQNFPAAASANAFLEVGIGSRAVGMGEAFTAVADDVSSLYWNPAGLGGLKSAQVLLMHNQWLQNVLFEHGAVSAPLPAGSLAASVTFVNYGTMDKIDDAGRVTGSFSAYDLSLALGYGLDLSPALSAGLAVKLPWSQVDQQNTFSLAADAGLLYRWPGWEPLRIGLALRNLGTRVQDYSQPLQSRLGVALVNWPQNLVFSLDADWRPLENSWRGELGAEYRCFGLLAARAGYQHPFAETGLGSGLSGLTLGAGFSQRFAETVFNLDYVFVPYGDLGSTHRLALTVELGAPPASRPQTAPARTAEKAPAQPAAPEPSAEPEAAPPLLPPVKLTVSPQGRRVMLSWAPAASSRPSGYQVYMKAAKGRWTKVNSRPVTQTKYTLSQLARKKTYEFKVTAVDASGQESESSQAARCFVK
ncbi:MAG: PorV/PorQ family protein [candidate division FCPU426 bacterium]